MKEEVFIAEAGHPNHRTIRWKMILEAYCLCPLTLLQKIIPGSQGLHVDKPVASYVHSSYTEALDTVDCPHLET